MIIEMCLGGQRRGEHFISPGKSASRQERCSGRFSDGRFSTPSSTLRAPGLWGGGWRMISPVLFPGNSWLIKQTWSEHSRLSSFSLQIPGDTQLLVLDHLSAQLGMDGILSFQCLLCLQRHLRRKSEKNPADPSTSCHFKSGHSGSLKIIVNIKCH